MIRFGNVSRCVCAQLVRACSRAAFAAWAALSFVVATSLAAAHFYTLPKPDSSDISLLAAIKSLRDGGDAGRWLAVHVLYAECRCSRRILEHLASSTRPVGVQEKLLLVGTPEQATAARRLVGLRGFEVVKTNPEALWARFHIQAAPLLLVADPGDVVRYAGGYSERKQGFALLDTEIIRELVTKRQPAELPLFGCAVSKELQGVLDPVSVVSPR